VIPPRILNRLAERLADVLAPPRSLLRRFEVAGVAVGQVDEARATMLERFRDVFVVSGDVVRLSPALGDAQARTDALDGVARALAAQGSLTRWRGERYAIAAAFDAMPLCLLERAAARFFGIRTFAVHVNGTTAREAAAMTWIARRSDDKPIDPGLLDNLVGGGIAWGTGVAATVEKEAFEEAGIPAAIARSARPAGTVEILREQPDGIQRETIFVHDLALPPDFVPCNQDGEVQGFALVTPVQVASLCANADGPDVMTADASLVIADWLMREGYVRSGSSAYAKLDGLRRVRRD
jgi:hypothetical protein